MITVLEKEGNHFQVDHGKVCTDTKCLLCWKKKKITSEVDTVRCVLT